MSIKEGLSPCYEWIQPVYDDSFCEVLSKELNLSLLSSRILCRRGVTSLEDADRFIRASLNDIRSPLLIKDIEKATERIVQAILSKENVLIYGDYDVDGLTSIAVLVHFLRYVGLDPLYYIPDRLREGYGFHADQIQSFARQGIQLIITVDCGITACDAVALANEAGIDVIITDHHECDDELPAALAVLNPKKPDNDFPFRELAGVGVAFYLVMALRRHMREKGIWGHLSEPNLRTYLDLVALGTLADMVPLKEENRIFVKHGLQEISCAKRPGLFILKEQAGLEGVISHVRPILYNIIPRINAPGRMGCAVDALKILLCEDSVEARKVARILEDSNLQRRSIEGQVYQEALSLAEEQIQDEVPSVLILASEGWHKGILGIVAARLARQYLRPVVLLSFDGPVGKGSIRSIDNFEIMDALVSSKAYLETYGGHRMAAGLSLKRDNLSAFQKAFREAIEMKMVKEERLRPPLFLDLWLEDPGEMTDQVLVEFDRMAPFGQGNAEPVIGMKGMRLVEKRIVGDGHLKLTVGYKGLTFEAIGFQMANRGIMESDHEHWDLAFTPRQEYWRGQHRLRLHLSDIKPS